MPARDGDWQEIIYLGSIHGVRPRLHQQLKVSHLGLLPTDVAEALEGFYELNCLFNHRLREQIVFPRRVNSEQQGAGAGESQFPLSLEGVVNSEDREPENQSKDEMVSLLLRQRLP
jgi:hypothetical protein